MRTEIIAVFIPIIGILVGGTIAVIAILSEHREKQEMIKKGIPFPEKRKRLSNGYSSLRLGALAIGVALGFILGGVFENADLFYDSETGYFASVFFFGGSALVLVSLYINKEVSKKNS